MLEHEVSTLFNSVEGAGVNTNWEKQLGSCWTSTATPNQTPYFL